MKNASTEKNKVHHDKEHGKTNKMVISNVKKKLTPASRQPKAHSPPQELEIWERSDPNFQYINIETNPNTNTNAQTEDDTGTMNENTQL